jgi:2-polyprenyl-3-methyl-5-hydroxy-6-metoxy-1,4-benzoquinol methylase
MHYTVRGLEIRSENAAKPASSASHWMLDWIQRQPRGARGLDLGCGKLRYTVPLARRISSVTAVDSVVQLNRRQTLFGKVRTVKDYISASLPNVRARSIDDRSWRRQRYQIILCSNVLSAIPCRVTRRRIVRAAYKCLAPGGKFLLTTQYRNSHFDSWRHNHRAKRYLDGYLVKNDRGVSFYGLLDSNALNRLCTLCGFEVHDSGHEREIAYVVAGKATKKSETQSQI